jgi:hypothetical protein
MVALGGGPRKTRKKVLHTGRERQCQCDPGCIHPTAPGEAFCAQHKRGCKRRAPLSGSEPKYEPDLWNGKDALRLTHNCFSYAMNVHDPKQLEKCKDPNNCSAGFHQPGSAAGYEGFTSEKPKTCSNMVARILGDNPNIRMSRFTKRCPRGTSKIALVVDQSDDYHFLRQDSNGWWSQKSGARPVTNKDASGRPIWDPRLSDLDYRKNNSNLNYDLFCGYMCVPRNRPLYLKVGGGRSRSRATRRRPRA